MREFASFGAFARHLELLSLEGAEVTEHMAEHSARTVRDIAKAKIGYYQPQVANYPAWAPLTAATEQEKAREGAPAGAPLLRHGAMYASIDYSIDHRGLETDAVIGSPSEILMWQELGTSRGLPPRPVMGPAGFESRHPIYVEGQEVLLAWISGKPWRQAIVDQSSIAP